MIRRLYLISFVVLPFFLNAQMWREVVQFVPNQSLHHIEFANDSVGFTVGSLFNTSTFNIHKTVDGGKSWIDQNSGYTATRFKDFHVFDENNVVMVGNFGLIIRTQDGGNFWETIPSNTSENFQCVYFMDDKNGWAGADRGVIARTTDGGLTWNILNTNIGHSMNDLHFFNEFEGLLCGFNVMKFTQDGGMTWNDIQDFPNPNRNYQTQEFSFVDNNFGVVSGDIGEIYWTQNAGRNWTLATTPHQASIQSIQMIDANVGYACGFEGRILKTIDGAQSWQQMISPTDQILFSIHFPSPDNGYICSWGGKVLKLDFPTSNKYVVQSEILIHPNPVTTHFIIEGLTRKAHYYIFNHTGQLMLQGEAINQQITLGHLPEGSYILSLIDPNGNHSQHRILKVR